LKRFRLGLRNHQQTNKIQVMAAVSNSEPLSLRRRSRWIG
jgi:hypothetical protein